METVFRDYMELAWITDRRVIVSLADLGASLL